MAIKNRQYPISVFLFFLFILGINAQDKTEKQPLYAILETVQNQYHYQFNYAKDSIDDLYIIPPSKDLTFNETLAYLEKTTGLTFVIDNENFVLVSKAKRLLICGYLKDKDSNTPIASVTIQGQENTAISDEKGFFQLLVNTISEGITIRHLGYKTTALTYSDFDSKTCATIHLVPNFQSLSEVMISNYIINGINKLSDGSFQIDFSNFDILPGVVDTDVLQSVQAFPGIQSSNETVSNLNIRGGSHDQNLILWDHIKMYQSGHFFGLISMYNPQITQKVTLRKNGSDVSQTDGVSGTISMETDNAVNTDFNGSLGVNFIDANGFVDTPVGKKSSVQIAARKSISDFIKTPTYNEFFERISQNTEVETNGNSIINSGKTFDFYDTSLRWNYQISDKDELRLNFINVSNELLFNENAIINDNEVSRKSSLSQNSIAGGIFYNRTWNHQWKTTLEVYETDYTLKSINANILDSQRFLQKNSVSETSLKAIANYRINKTLQLQSGYHFVETEVTNLDDVDNPLYHLLVSEVIRAHSGFSEIKYTSLNKNTYFNAGVRFNYLNKFKRQLWEPRISFNQRFLNYFTIEILGEFKHQYTSQIVNFQNDFLGIEKYRWQLSNNKDIPIITSKQISVGFSYNHQGWLSSIEGYYKKVDGITTQSQGFQNQYKLNKTNGFYEVNGIDLLLRKRIDAFNIWLSYAFMNNTYVFNDLTEKQFPSNYDITHALTLGTTYATKKLKIATGINWQTGKPTTLPLASNSVIDNEVQYKSANSDRLKNYMRIDVSALYNLKICHHINAKIGVALWNVLNTKNTINSFYDANENMLIHTTQNALGITPNMFIRVSF